MKTIIRLSVLALVLFVGIDNSLVAQSSVGLGAQVKTESAIVDGGKYVVQSQASGTPYMEDAGTYYSVPNAGNSPTTAAVYYFYKNDDGTWKIKNQHTGKYWGVPVYGENLAPAIELEAGNWSLNFNSGVAYPRAAAADGQILSMDRSSQKIVGWTTSTSVAQRIKIFEVDAPLSSEALVELAGKMVHVNETPAADLQVGQWYTMFDRGFTNGNPHGYLYENANSHTLYNTATTPSGTAVTAARYLVRLEDAGDGQYYVQNGYGNYFGAFVQATVVPVVADKSVPVIIDKIAGTDGHFYLQTPSTGIILDANDLSGGDSRATVVGWGSTAPTTIGGNNDWAFYPVELEDIGEEVALFTGDVNVVQGYQTTGRGNKAVLLRIDIVPSKPLQSATFNFTINDDTRDNISALAIYETKGNEILANFPEEPIGSSDDVNATMGVTIENVTAGTHYYWLCATVKEDAALGVILDAALASINYMSTAEVELDVSAQGNPSRPGAKVFDRQTVVFAPTSDDCRFYRIPAMILDADGNIVVCADKRYNSNSDLGNHKIDVVSKRSEDGGRTWQDLATVAVGDGRTAAYFGYGDAALARASNGDLVCLMAAGNKMWGSNATDGMRYAGFAKSTDNGKTWKLTPNIFDTPGFYDENSSDGSLSMSNIFTTSGKGLTTSDGVIMFTTNCRKMNTSSPNLIYIIYSTDNGGHWRLSKSLAYSGGDESKLEQMNDGTLLLSVRQSGDRGWNTAKYTKKDDGTVTFKWGTQYRSSDLWGNACNADLVYYSRQSETEPDIMLHSYINTSGRESLQMSMSLNGGKKWQDVFNIQVNGSCYSTMVVLPDGDVAILYEDASYDVGNGYAINFVTITRDQIIEWFEQLGGELPDGIVGREVHPASGDGRVYNIAGQQMNELRRGVNIVNGKKVILK